MKGTLKRIARRLRDCFGQTAPGAELKPLHTVPDVSLPAGPQSLFQEAYYLALYPDVAGKAASPLEHYRETGWKEGKNPNPYLYSSWYMEKYPDAAVSGLSPLDHYFEHGAAKDTEASRLFSEARQYCRDNGMDLGSTLAG